VQWRWKAQGGEGVKLHATALRGSLHSWHTGEEPPRSGFAAPAARHKCGHAYASIQAKNPQGRGFAAPAAWQGVAQSPQGREAGRHDRRSLDAFGRV